MRHIVLADQNGLDTKPDIVAEFGPGGSLGIGLIALLCGSKKYFAFDIVPHTNKEINLHILEELIALLARKIDIPHKGIYQTIKPEISNYDFPSHIFTDERLKVSLQPERIQAIRKCLTDNSDVQSIEIRYYSPWYETHALQGDYVDMIISQAVLEHVDDLHEVYKKMALWLKPSGVMSHQIDFKSHGTAKTWNGHWAYSDFIWKLIKGNRAYLLNRQPYSRHLELLKEYGFSLHYAQKVKMLSTISSGMLASGFKDISDEDLETSGAFIQALKKGESLSKMKTNHSL